ncbi:hypothetical protein [Nannocystis exedens]|uniref:hypothetical protein n=1 Tax=Nannocystis exedens TaxID=54 RepID=UPI0011607768|nr:hypothetical protein [Nannocystis exedens]
MVLELSAAVIASPLVTSPVVVLAISVVPAVEVIGSISKVEPEVGKPPVLVVDEDEAAIEESPVVETEAVVEDPPVASSVLPLGL